MLRPRKNHLIDGPVVVNDSRRIRRWQFISAAMLALILVLVTSWASSQRDSSKIPDEVWWRRLISSVAAKRLSQEVDSSAVVQMKQRVTELEADRIALSSRLTEAEKLLNADRSKQRLSQVVARREGESIAFEILLRSPPGETARPRLSVNVMAVKDPSAKVASANPQAFSIDVDRSTRMSITSPEVAETLQGRLASDASHLLVMLSSTGENADTEMLLVPVMRNR